MGGRRKDKTLSTARRRWRAAVRKFFLINGICFLLIVAGAIFLLYESSRVYGECYAEAGVEVTAQDFLRNPKEEAYFAEDSDPIDIAVPGEYHVKVKTGFFTHMSTLYIADTKAPRGEPVRVSVELGQECGADAFVADIRDATKVQVSYRSQPDFTMPGTQKVEILLTDLGGNRTVVASELFVSRVVLELTVEAGGRPPGLQDFIIVGEEAEFISDIDAYDYMTLGDRTVELRVDGVDYTTTMHIVDTVPPKVEVQDVHDLALLPKSAEDFILSVEDLTETKAKFVKEPDLTYVGEQTVEISVTDTSGNETIKTAKLTLEKDTEPPVINGVTDLRVLAGGSVAYKKNVTVTDNCPEGVDLSVDNSQVNLSVEGTYPVTYIARDLAGNEARVTAQVIVLPKDYEEREVYELADKALADIITQDMTPEQKLEAIYSYIQSHITYTSHSEKSTWEEAAYEGLAEGKGDCYVYACTARALLTGAGITNIDIASIPGETNHYWNLVDVGDGWYHFDTTPRADDHPHICMWTEAQLMEYSAAHGNSHNYDHSQYPEVN